MTSKKKSLSWWIGLALAILTAVSAYLATGCSLTRNNSYKVDSISAYGVDIHRELGSSVTGKN